jgi:hypothetical protein
VSAARDGSAGDLEIEGIGDSAHEDIELLRQNRQADTIGNVQSQGRCLLRSDQSVDPLAGPICRRKVDIRQSYHLGIAVDGQVVGGRSTLLSGAEDEVVKAQLPLP